MFELLIPYLIAITLLTITPGLDTTLILRTSVLEEKQKAFHVALGINSGCILWGMIVACSLGYILNTSPLIFNAIKWMGVIYLVLIGFQMLLQPRTQVGTAINQPSSHNWFIRGLLGNLLNPKVGIFYLAFLPQFVPKSAPFFLSIMLLVLIHIFLGLLWAALIIYGSQKMTKYLTHSKLVTYLDRITGGVLIFFAVKLVFAER